MFNVVMLCLNKDECNEVVMMLFVVIGSCNCIWSLLIDCVVIKCMFLLVR